MYSENKTAISTRPEKPRKVDADRPALVELQYVPADMARRELYLIAVQVELRNARENPARFRQ
jgi:hypothetical protein